MINVGDMVSWYEKENMRKKYGQVISIMGDDATVFCDKDKKAYIVPVNRLAKV